MAVAFPASFVDFLLGLSLAPADRESGSRFSLEELALGRPRDGALEIRIAGLEATALRAGPKIAA